MLLCFALAWLQLAQGIHNHLHHLLLTVPLLAAAFACPHSDAVVQAITFCVGCSTPPNNRIPWRQSHLQTQQHGQPSDLQYGRASPLRDERLQEPLSHRSQAGESIHVLLLHSSCRFGACTLGVCTLCCCALLWLGCNLHKPYTIICITFCSQSLLLAVAFACPHSDAVVQANIFCVGCRTPPNNRTPWQQSHLQTQANVYKPHAQPWYETLHGRLQHWTVTCSNYFLRPIAMVCAFAFLAQFTVSSEGQWNCCLHCTSNRKPNAACAVFISQSYQRSLLSCLAFQQQSLFVLDCRVDDHFMACHYTTYIAKPCTL